MVLSCLSRVRDNASRYRATLQGTTVESLFVVAHARQTNVTNFRACRPRRRCPEPGQRDGTSPSPASPGVGATHVVVRVGLRRRTGAATTRSRDAPAGRAGRDKPVPYGVARRGGVARAGFPRRRPVAAGTRSRYAPAGRAGRDKPVPYGVAHAPVVGATLVVARVGLRRRPAAAGTRSPYAPAGRAGRDKPVPCGVAPAPGVGATLVVARVGRRRRAGDATTRSRYAPAGRAGRDKPVPYGLSGSGIR